MKPKTTIRLLLGMIGIGLSLLPSQAQDPGEIELLAWWEFDDNDTPNVAVDTVAGIEGEVREAKYAEGRTGGFSMDFSEAGSTVAIIGEEENKAGFLNKGGARDQLSFAFWQKWDEPIRNQSAFWTRADGMDRAAQVHTPWGNGTVYFDTSGGCCDAATQRTNVDASDLPWEDEWIHFSFIKNKATKQLWANGELLIESENTGEFNDAFQDLFIGSAVDGGNNHGGRIDDFAVFAGALSVEQIQTLADPSSSVLTIIDNSNPGITLNEGQKLSAGTLPALSSDQELRFRVKNTVKPDDERGAKTLNISSVEITGGDTDNFTLVSFPASLAPGASDDLVLSFNNKGAFGSFRVTVNAKSDDEDADDQNITFTISATVLNPVGPVAHYPLDETNKADGAADVTGQGHPGEYREPAGSIALGQDGLKAGSGTAAKFSGGANLAVATLPEGTLNSYTISTWVNPASLGTLGDQDFRTIIAKGQESPVFALLEASGELIWFGEADGVADAIFLTEGAGIAAGTTYHIAMRYDATTGTGSILVDGVSKGSGAVPPVEDLGTFYAGAFGGGALPFDGTLDDVQIYDIALTEEQIAYLIANPGKPLIPDPGVGIDTDGDGLSDDDEATIHKTNPLKADTDGDGLKDGQEVAAGTDPLKVDTDGDGNSDASELLFGSNPLDAADRLGTFLVRTIKAVDGLEFGDMDTFKAALDDQSQIADEHVGNYTFVNFRDNAQGRFANDEAPFGLWDTFGDRNDYGIYVTGKIQITEAGVRTFGMNSDDGNQLFIDGELVAEDPGTHGSQDIFGSIELSEGEHDLEMFFYERGGGAQVELFVNTQLGAVESFDAGTFVLLPAFGDAEADVDKDGLNDFFENGFFGNLDATPDGDPDEDGLNNLAEMNAGTNPTVADTDGDGRSDGDEVNGPVTSNPRVADTDKDGLTDGDEIAAGTDPNNRDTDGDGFGDGFEVVKGTDPLVAEAGGGGNPYDLRAAWEFNTAAAGGNVLDDIGGVVGILQDSAVLAADGGQSGEAGDGALDLTSGTSLKVEDVEFFNDIAGNDVMSLVFWQKLDSVTNQTTFKAQSPSSSGTERGWSVHTPWSNNIIYFDTVGCCDGATQRINVDSPAGIDYTGWHHFGFVKNGSTKQIWVDGVMIHEAENTSPLPTDFTALWIGAAIDGGESTVGLLDDFGIFATALDESAMLALASGTRPTVLGGGANDNPYSLLAMWDFNDADSTDVAVDNFGGAIGRLEGSNYSPDGAGRTGQAGDYAFDGNAGQLVIDDVNVLFLNEAQAVDQVTFSFWQNLNSVRNSSTFWSTAEGAGGDRAAQAHVSWGDGNIYFDTAGCCAGPQRISGPAPGGYDAGWHHYAFVKDGPNKSVWMDGVKVFEGGDAAPLPENFTALFVSGDAGGANLVDGLVDEFAVFGFALPEDVVGRLAAGERADQLGGGTPPTPGAEVPVIGSVVAGPSSLGLSFTGLAGKTYDIEYSTDLQNWSVIASDLSGDINFEDSDAARQGLSGGYYRGVQK